MTPFIVFLLRLAPKNRRIAAAALLASPAGAGVIDGVQAVDGLTVYLGVVPAAVTRGHAPQYEERTMHGGVTVQACSASAQKQKPARLYRYPAPLLIGPWRETHEQAIDDALKARQARLDNPDLNAVRWMVSGLIEQGTADSPN